MDRHTLSLMSCGLISIYIFQLPMSFFTTRRTGDIVSRFNDIVSIIDALVSTIFNTFIATLTVIIVYIFLFYQNKVLFFISVLALPLYCAIIWSFVKFFDKLNYEIMESNATLSSSIIETINGIETVKALTSENKCYQKIDREFSIYIEKRLHKAKWRIFRKF
ncbi:transport/processing ATP-binding protein ComA [Streptococcus porcinus]|nr:transport/processing ATP-binding protein ComA [Streptococcus porcinus]